MILIPRVVADSGEEMKKNSNKGMIMRKMIFFIANFPIMSRETPSDTKNILVLNFKLVKDFYQNFYQREICKEPPNLNPGHLNYGFYSQHIVVYPCR